MLDCNKKLAGIVVMVTNIMMLIGCSKVTYSPPGKLEPEMAEFAKVVSQPFEETWQKLVSHVLQERYMIDTYDKASGSMTFSFGHFKPSRFVDCGVFIRGSSSYPFLDLPHARRELEVQMYVRLDRNTAGETRIIAQAVYNIYYRSYWYFKGVEMVAAQWEFETGGSDEQFVGESRLVECRSTYAAERGVIEAVSNVTQ